MITSNNYSLKMDTTNVFVNGFWYSIFAKQQSPNLKMYPFDDDTQDIRLLIRNMYPNMIEDDDYMEEAEALKSKKFVDKNDKEYLRYLLYKKTSNSNDWEYSGTILVLNVLLELVSDIRESIRESNNTDVNMYLLILYLECLRCDDIMRLLNLQDCLQNINMDYNNYTKHFHKLDRVRDVTKLIEFANHKSITNNKDIHDMIYSALRLALNKAHDANEVDDIQRIHYTLKDVWEKT